MKCVECNGSGDIKLVGYRDNASVKDEVMLIGRLSRLCKWFLSDRHWLAILVVSIIIALLILATPIGMVLGGILFVYYINELDLEMDRLDQQKHDRLDKRDEMRRL